MNVDASKDAVGAVIMQQGRPIAYASSTLTKSQSIQGQIEKECLAILFGCTKFHDYLFMSRVTVETDHKPLITLFKKEIRKCPITLQRLRLKLSPYIIP